jgi:hypothetical protein
VKRQTASRFALWSAASATIVALALVPLALSRGEVVLGWGLAGWFLTAAAGVGGGAWLVSRHGKPGPGFLVAMGVCMLARSVLFVAGPFAAASLGVEAVLACVAGLFAGYLPPQAAEVIWFARSSANS